VFFFFFGLRFNDLAREKLVFIIELFSLEINTADWCSAVPAQGQRRQIFLP